MSAAARRAVSISVARLPEHEGRSHGRGDPTASIPFDARRSGFCHGRGRRLPRTRGLTHAQQRSSATILAEVARLRCAPATARTTSPARLRTAKQPHISAAPSRMRGLTPALTIDYINAHGTSTPLNEVRNHRHQKKAFGGEAYGNKVSSRKSMTAICWAGAAARLRPLPALWQASVGALYRRPSIYKSRIGV